MNMTGSKSSCEACICRMLKHIVDILRQHYDDETRQEDNVKTTKAALDKAMDDVTQHMVDPEYTRPLGCVCIRNSEDDSRLILKKLMTLPFLEGSPSDTLRDKIVTRLVEICPQLIVNDDEDGLTALHLALLQEDYRYKSRYELLLKMIDKIPEVLKRKTGSQLHKGTFILANGSMFKGTKMEAGTILGVAALSTSNNKKTVFNKLLNAGFDLHQKTENNDNILHSIIKHRQRNQNEADVLKSTMQIVEECIFRSDDRKRYQMLTDVNNDHLTPVVQAAQYADFDMYKFFMTRKTMRRSVWSDGLIDVHTYDVTDIETIQPPKKRTQHRQDIPQTSAAKEDSKTVHISVLEFDGHGQSQNEANKFALFSPIKKVIRCKWHYYQWFLLVWFFFHLASTLCLYATGYYRAKFLSNNASNGKSCLECSSDNGIHRTAFGLTICELILGVMYMFPIVCELVRLRKRRYTICPSFSHAYSNLLFRLLYLLFGPLIVLDAGLALRDVDSPFLPFALVIACYMFLFFLQVISLFSTFTVIIQKVIPEMTRFLVVMTILSSGFSMAMFFVMHGADANDDSFERFDKAVIKMVSIMIGLGEIDNLFTSRLPVVAISIFILFVLLTTILLLNSLIAIMSNTCSLVMTAQREGYSVYYEHCFLQTLSVILYIEHICIFDCLLKEVGQMEPSHFMKGKRRLLKVGTVSDVTADSVESPSTSLTTQMLSSIFTTRNTTKRPKKNSVKSLDDTLIGQKSFGTKVNTLEINELVEGMICSNCGSKRVHSTA